MYDNVYVNQQKKMYQNKLLNNKSNKRKDNFIFISKQKLLASIIVESQDQVTFCNVTNHELVTQDFYFDHNFRGIYKIKNCVPGMVLLQATDIIL